MSNKSIDGLQRRTGPRTIGVADKKSRTAIKPAASVAKKTKAKPTTSSPELMRVNSEYDEAIKDFLSGVQDDDPTSLVGELPERKEQKKVKSRKATPKKKRGKRIVWSIVGILLIVIIGAGAWLYVQGNDLVSRVTGGGNLWDALTSDPDTLLEMDASSGRTNILIFGTEGYSMDDPNYDGGWLTDSIMVASLDQDTGDVRMVSLPRDLKARTCTSTSKLNEVYYCTYYKNDGTAEGRAESEKLAARELATQIEEILGIEIQYFVHANWQAVVQIVDTLGGIDVAFVYKGTNWTGDEVAIETTDKRGLADWNRYCKCYVVQFENDSVAHLDGAQALAVARARNEAGGYGAGGGNFSREQFQQKILQAVILKAKETNFVTDFMAALQIKDAVGDNLRMDFKDTELKTLFKLAGKIDMGNLQSIPLQTTDDGTSLLRTGMLPVPGVNSIECGGSSPGCLSYVYPTAGAGNYTAIHAYIDKKLSSDPLVSEGARIEIMNATAATGLASSEKNILVNKGYNVVKTTNAPADLGEIDGVRVYQLNKSMAGTAKALQELYGNVLVAEVPEVLANEAADFVVVIGNGYMGEME